MYMYMLYASIRESYCTTPWCSIGLVDSCNAYAAIAHRDIMSSSHLLSVVDFLYIFLDIYYLFIIIFLVLTQPYSLRKGETKQQRM